MFEGLVLVMHSEPQTISKLTTLATAAAPSNCRKSLATNEANTWARHVSEVHEIRKVCAVWR